MFVGIDEVEPMYCAIVLLQISIYLYCLARLLRPMKTTRVVIETVNCDVRCCLLEIDWQICQIGPKKIKNIQQAGFPDGHPL